MKGKADTIKEQPEVTEESTVTYRIKAASVTVRDAAGKDTGKRLCRGEVIVVTSDKDGLLEFEGGFISSGYTTKE